MPIVQVFRSSGEASKEKSSEVPFISLSNLYGTYVFDIDQYPEVKRLQVAR